MEKRSYVVSQLSFDALLTISTIRHNPACLSLQP